jgi:hypothetical protein
MMVQLEAECVIEAPTSLVWQILADLDTYSEWNLFTKQIVIADGKAIGSPVKLHVTLGKQSIVQKEVLSEWDDNKHVMAWVVNMCCFLRTERIQQVTDEGCGKSRYYNRLKLSGFLTHLIVVLYGKDMQSGFDSVARSLKERCEAMYSKSRS